jgi:hypothetical protein
MNTDTETYHLTSYHNYYFNNSMMLSCISFAYLPVIFGIKKIMQSLPPFKNTFSNYLLGSWNLFLSTGSLIGAYYTLPYLVNDIQTHVNKTK